MITIRLCKNIRESARLTYENMRMYYEQFAPEWDEVKVSEQITNLENWDILDKNKIVGVLRIEFDDKICYLRDLQVISSLQNKGIGADALAYAKMLAINKGSERLSLRVLKISPAFRLYERSGFSTIREDERFYYMEKKVT